jgi:hypothetical protein
LAAPGGAESAIVREWGDVVRDPSWDVVEGDAQEIVAIQIASRISAGQIEGLEDLADAFASELQAGTSLFRHRELRELLRPGKGNDMVNTGEIGAVLCTLAGVVQVENGVVRIGAEHVFSAEGEAREWLAGQPAYLLGSAYAVAERVRLEGVDRVVSELQEMAGHPLIKRDERAALLEVVRRCGGG